MAVVSTLKHILGQNIFVSDGSKYRIDGALNVVYFAIFHNSKRLNITSQIGGGSWLHHQYDLLLKFVRKNSYIVPYCLDVSDLIKYRYIVLTICSDNVLVSGS